MTGRVTSGATGPVAWPTRLTGGSPAITFAESRPAGPTVVLFHGVTRCRDDWQGVLPRLDGVEGSRGWRVIAVDHRGHGDSARAEHYLVTDYVADAVRLIRHEIAAPVVVLGHSLGGMVAAGVAAELPDLVRGVVLEDPPFQGMAARIHGTAWQAQFRGMQSAGRRGGSVAELAAALAAIELPAAGGGTIRLGDIRDAAALRWSASCLARLDPEVLTPVIAGRWLDDYDPVGVARRIRCPVVLLQADPLAGGALADDEAATFAAAATDCVVERFPGCGHLLHWQHPDRIVAAVERLMPLVDA